MPRLTPPTRLRLSLLALGALGPVGCFGGPTSDLPNSATSDRPSAGQVDNEGASGANGGGDSEGVGGNSNGSGTGGMDAGAPPLSGADGGVDRDLDGGAPCTGDAGAADCVIAVDVDASAGDAGN